LNDTLDRLTILAREDSRELDPKDSKGRLVKLSEIFDRLKRLLIIFKRDVASASSIYF